MQDNRPVNELSLLDQVLGQMQREESAPEPQASPSSDGLIDRVEADVEVEQGAATGNRPVAQAVEDAVEGAVGGKDVVSQEPLPEVAGFVGQGVPDAGEPIAREPQLSDGWKTRKPARSRVRVALAYVAVFVLTPVTLIVATLLGDENYYLTSVLVIVYAMVPVFVSFETRAPQARELVVLAVMCAIAVASRVAFVWLPAFKPMAGVILIMGIALGARAGFMGGAISALVSNFVFSQGPWTPWQMFAFGLAGFVAGLLADRGVIPRSSLSLKQMMAVSIGGGLFIVCILGPILDTCSVFTMVAMPDGFDGAVAVYAAGFPLNCVHGLATFATLLLVGNPLLDKLERVRVKYGFES